MGWNVSSLHCVKWINNRQTINICHYSSSSFPKLFNRESSIRLMSKYNVLVTGSSVYLKYRAFLNHICLTVSSHCDYCINRWGVFLLILRSLQFCTFQISFIYLWYKYNVVNISECLWCARILRWTYVVGMRGAWTNTGQLK